MNETSPQNTFVPEAVPVDAPPLFAAVAADEFATRLGPALTTTDDAIFDWLAIGQPVDPVPPPQPLHPDDIAIALPKPPVGADGRVTRAKGAPASVVLDPLAAFLDEHRDEQVVVEWRVQE